MKAQSTTLTRMFLHPLQLLKCSYFRYCFENILIQRVFCGLRKHAKAQNYYYKIEENCQFLPVCILLETYIQNKNITYFSVTFYWKTLCNNNSPLFWSLCQRQCALLGELLIFCSYASSPGAINSAKENISVPF